MTNETAAAVRVDRIEDLEADDALEQLFRDMYAHFEAVAGRALLKPGGFAAWGSFYGKTAGKSRLVVGARGSSGLIGFAEGLLRAAPAYQVSGVTGFVAHIYVAPEARGLRVAQRLYEALQEWFASSGVAAVELQVIAGNVGAERFWSGLGFTLDNQQMRMKLR